MLGNEILSDLLRDTIQYATNRCVNQLREHLFMYSVIFSDQCFFSMLHSSNGTGAVPCKVDVFITSVRPIKCHVFVM